MTETTQVPTITLNDGRAIPQLGFGVFQVPPEDTAETTGLALEVGYRHIDTAQGYSNEQGVGDAVRDSSLERDAVWITSKLTNRMSEPDEIRASFEESLRKLGSDHVDLFLIHWPLPKREGSDFVVRWKVLEEFKADGRARSIGVSNFEVPHLQRLAAECDVVPAVNQIEIHPYLLNEEVRAYGESQGIATEAWSPIAQGGVLADPVITEIAERVGRTSAQVVLRWHVQRDSIVFPKSVTPERIRENFELFDFELTAADMAAITGLDKGEAGRTGPNPNEFTG
jgi:2,5-diketo-D-gluconate reductase A